MSYLDKPTWSGDAVTGAFLTMGGASASGVFCLILWSVVYEPTAVLFGLPLAIAAFIAGLWLAFIALLLFVAPATFALIKLRAENGWSYAVLGGCAGICTSLLLLREMSIPAGFQIVPLIAGTVGGIVWWRSYRRHFQESETLSG